MSLARLRGIEVFCADPGLAQWSGLSIFMGASHGLRHGLVGGKVAEGSPVVQGMAGGGGFCPRGVVADLLTSPSCPWSAVLWCW